MNAFWSWLAVSSRRVFALFLAVAGPVMTAWGLWLTWQVIYGPWSPASEAQRLTIIGWAILMVHGGLLLVLISHAIGGPLHSIKATIMGNSIDVGGDQK